MSNIFNRVIDFFLAVKTPDYEFEYYYYANQAKNKLIQDYSAKLNIANNELKRYSEIIEEQQELIDEYRRRFDEQDKIIRSQKKIYISLN